MSNSYKRQERKQRVVQRVEALEVRVLELELEVVGYKEAIKHNFDLINHQAMLIQGLQRYKVDKPRGDAE